MTFRVLVFLGFPIWKKKKKKISSSSEFSAIRVRRKISYFLGWIVELTSRAINEHHKTHCPLVKCKTSTSVVPPLTRDLKIFLGKAKSPVAGPCLLGKGWHRAGDKCQSHLSVGSWKVVIHFGGEPNTQTFKQSIPGSASPTPPQLHTKATREFCLSNRMPLTHSLGICCSKTLEDVCFIVAFYFFQ